jgi:hypothetical protein
MEKFGNIASAFLKKTPLWLKLTATGIPGHGSTPGANLAVHKLVTALNRILQYRSPIKVVPEVQKYYGDIAQLETPGREQQYRDLKTALQDPAFAAEFTKDPRNNGNVRNTIAITGVKGSGQGQCDSSVCDRGDRRQAFAR